MSNVFFISDTHWGHKSIISWERNARPFKTIEEHDETLIDNWNSTVGPNDVVWHLGDVVWSRSMLPHLARLNGRKFLVLGNHDNSYPTARWLEHFNRVAAAEEFDGGVLTHIPIHPYQQYRYNKNIHGHLHSALVEKEGDFGSGFKPVPDPFYWNVSCEQVNYTPIAYEELKARHTQ